MAGRSSSRIGNPARSLWTIDVAGGRVIHNAAGTMGVALWWEMVAAFPRVSLDAFVLIPNHLHAIVRLSREGAIGYPPLGDVAGRFKSITTARYSTCVHTHGWPPYDRCLWQWNYYEHIVRGAPGLDRCRRYIAANPANRDTNRDRDPERPPTV